MKATAIWLAISIGAHGATLEVGDGRAYATVAAALAAANSGDTVSVFDGVYAEDVTLADAGLTLAAADGAAPWIVGRVVVGQSNVTVRGLGIGGWTNANAGGVHVSGYSGMTVENCSITNAGSASGSGIYTRNGSSHLIRSNTITGCATGVNVNSGVGSSYETGIRIVANRIATNHFDGLDIHGRFITISGNEIFRNFDTNWVATHPDGIQLIDTTIDGHQSCQDIWIVRNRIWSHPQNIFGGYYTTNILIANNVLWSETGVVSGVDLDAVTTKHIALFSGRDVLIANNTLGRAINSGIYVSYDAGQASGGIRVTNNIITGIATGGIAVFFGNASDIGGIDHNLYYGNGYDARIASTYYSTVGDFAAATAYEDHGVSGNPLLTAWIPGVGSPAIGAAATLSEFTDDFTGRVRSAPWDIGAYESGTTAMAGSANIGILTFP